MEDTTLKLMAMETGVVREYVYDVDEKILWVTDLSPDMRCLAKRWQKLSWNPIEKIREKAMSQNGISLEPEDNSLDID